MTRDDTERGEGQSWTALYRRPETAARYDRRFRGLGSWNNRWIWRVLARELDAGGWPRLVIDAPAGTGRYTARLRARGARVVHLDLSPAMLAELRRKHGGGSEVLGDLLAPPLAAGAGALVLCLRLLQHLDSPQRIAALRALRLMAPRALVAYYPGWHYKLWTRRLRRRIGLPHGPLRERLTRQQIQDEVQAAGWRLHGLRRVLPWLSEYVLLSLVSPP